MDGGRFRTVTLARDGLLCPAGGFHVDPWRPVGTAVVTHAHGDHARPGSGVYHCARSGAGLMRRRIGADADVRGHDFGEPFRLGEATVSLHPAGHVLGSAQVRIEVAGEVWVISGDYKREPDPSCEPFEVVPCDVFVTEATFALPIYRWDPPDRLIDEVMGWWAANAREGRASVVFGYALGKAQRLLAGIGGRTDRAVFVHGAVEPLTRAYREEGISLAPTRPVSEAEKGASFAGELVIAPPSAFGTPWMRRFGDCRTAFCSGWMRVRGHRRRRGFDHGFVLSDHADWRDLLSTVRDTRASMVYATHGYADVLARYLREEAGIDAAPLRTLFGDGTED